MPRDACGAFVNRNTALRAAGRASRSTRCRIWKQPDAACRFSGQVLPSIVMSEPAAGLRLELFTRDMTSALDFYRRVLGFEPRTERPGGYTPLVRGSARIALNLQSELEPGHPLRAVGGERAGLGVEIVLEVDDVEEMHRHVVATGWPRSAELQRRPWGLTDFRVLDPDGYYWRVTSRPKAVEPC